MGCPARQCPTTTQGERAHLSNEPLQGHSCCKSGRKPTSEHPSQLLAPCAARPCTAAPVASRNGGSGERPLPQSCGGPCYVESMHPCPRLQSAGVAWGQSAQPGALPETPPPLRRLGRRRQRTRHWHSAAACVAVGCCTVPQRCCMCQLRDAGSGGASDTRHGPYARCSPAAWAGGWRDRVAHALSNL